MPLLLEYKGNNLRHQHGDKYRAATVSFCRIYAKLAKYEKCSETIICAQRVSFGSVLHLKFKLEPCCELKFNVFQY